MLTIELNQDELITIELALEDVHRAEFAKYGKCKLETPCERYGDVLYCSECEHMLLDTLRYLKAHRLYHRLLATHMNYIISSMRDDIG